MTGVARGAGLGGYRSPSGLALSPLTLRKTEELTKIVYTKYLTLPMRLIMQSFRVVVSKLGRLELFIGLKYLTT